MPDRFSLDELDHIRDRHAAAPFGPYVRLGHQLVANVVVESPGRWRVNGHGPEAIVVLDSEGGLAFCERAHGDVGRLLAHIEALQRKVAAQHHELRELREPQILDMPPLGEPCPTCGGDLLHISDGSLLCVRCEAIVTYAEALARLRTGACG